MVEEVGAALVGFGEAGGAFAGGWRDAGVRVGLSAFDIKTDSEETRSTMLARYAEFGVRGAEALADALRGARVVFSVVTADQALAAAKAASAHLEDGALWLDCNSCAPDTKRQAAEAVHAHGGRYVDVAVMAPVHPKRHEVPLLVSGPHAEAAEAVLRMLGMKPENKGLEIGRASSIKMLRSVMIKGMEALVGECLLSARRAGVEDDVLASLEASDPDIRWRERATYNLDRMMVHGARRAAELREVEKTVAALGLPSGMSAATAVWEDWVAELGLDPGEADLVGRLDRVLAARFGNG